MFYILQDVSRSVISFWVKHFLIIEVNLNFLKPHQKCSSKNHTLFGVYTLFWLKYLKSSYIFLYNKKIHILRKRRRRLKATKYKILNVSASKRFAKDIYYKSFIF